VKILANKERLETRRPLIPTPNRERLEREVKAFAAAVRQDFITGWKAIIPPTAGEKSRPLD